MRVVLMLCRQAFCVLAEYAGEFAVEPGWDEQEVARLRHCLTMVAGWPASETVVRPGCSLNNFTRQYTTAFC